MAQYEEQIRVLSKPNHLIGGRKCQVRMPLSKVVRSCYGVLPVLYEQIFKSVKISTTKNIEEKSKSFYRSFCGFLER